MRKNEMEARIIINEKLDVLFVYSVAVSLSARVDFNLLRTFMIAPARPYLVMEFRVPSIFFRLPFPCSYDPLSTNQTEPGPSSFPAPPHSSPATRINRETLPCLLCLANVISPRRHTYRIFQQPLTR